jgi:hypothetical protein
MADVAIPSEASAAVPSHAAPADIHRQDKSDQTDKNNASAASSVKQITPRPTYISNSDQSQESKLPHQLLTRKDTIDLDDYFVCLSTPMLSL